MATHSMISRGIIDSVHKAAKEQSEMKVVRGAARVENGKSKRRDYKRENFPGLTVSYRGLVEYQAEIVSASRTRDKLPFLSSPLVIYPSIRPSLSSFLSFPPSFDVYLRVHIFHDKDSRHCSRENSRDREGKENWDYSLWEYSSSKALARGRARVLHACL